MGKRSQRRGLTRREKIKLKQLRKKKKLTRNEEMLKKRFEQRPGTLSINVKDGVKTGEKVG